MKKTFYILYLVIFGSIVCAHATSVENCTYVSYGVQQCELRFVSPNICIILQTNRTSSETHTDTVEYTCKKNVVSILPKYSYDKGSNTDGQFKSTQYRLDPYIYIDGKHIKGYPLGGTAVVRRSYPFMFVEKNIGDFISFNDTLQFELLTPDLMVERSKGNYYGLFKLTSGRPEYDIRPLRMKYIRIIRKYIKRCYMWGYYWFSREKYEKQAASTMSGLRYEYASPPTNESLEFLNDSICVYALLNNEIKASLEYYCNYSKLPNGIIVIRTDSVASTGGDMKTFFSEQMVSSSMGSDLISLTTIVCDTFLLYDDVLYYAKIYPKGTYSHYDKPTLGDRRGTPISNKPETHLLQTKAFVRTGKKKNPVKIAKFYQNYYIPINY